MTNGRRAVLLRSIAVVAALTLVPTMVAAKSARELDRQCYEDRQKKLEPQRQAMIDQCIARGDDAAYCKRYYRDYGEGGTTLYGTRRKGLYNDLPSCRAAEQARMEQNRNNRGSTTGVEDRTDRSGVRDRSSSDGVNRSR